MHVDLDSTFFLLRLTTGVQPTSPVAEVKCSPGVSSCISNLTAWHDVRSIPGEASRRDFSTSPPEAAREWSSSESSSACSLPSGAVVGSPSSLGAASTWFLPVSLGPTFRGWNSCGGAWLGVAGGNGSGGALIGAAGKSWHSPSCSFPFFLARKVSSRCSLHLQLEGERFLLRFLCWGISRCEVVARPRRGPAVGGNSDLAGSSSTSGFQSSFTPVISPFLYKDVRAYIPGDTSCISRDKRFWFLLQTACHTGKSRRSYHVIDVRVYNYSLAEPDRSGGGGGGRTVWTTDAHQNWGGR